MLKTRERNLMPVIYGASVILIIGILFVISNVFVKAEGAEYPVTDFEQFQEALETAGRGDTILIQGMIEMDEQVIFEKNLTIKGDGAGAGFEVSGMYSIFYMDGVNVVFTDLEFYCADEDRDTISFEPRWGGLGGNSYTISNCHFYEGSVLICGDDNDKRFTVEDSVFDGEVEFSSDIEANIKNCIINSYFNIYGMGTVYVYDVTINGEYSVEEEEQGNISIDDGNLHVDGLQTNDAYIVFEIEGDIEDGVITDALIENSNIFGAIVIAEARNVILDNTVLGPETWTESEEYVIEAYGTENIMIQGDSKIINCNQIYVDESNMTIKDNTEISGIITEESPIYFSGYRRHTLTITDNVSIMGNSGEYAGFLANDGGTVYIDGKVIIHNNTSQEWAGVIYNMYGDLYIGGEAAIYNNRAEVDGGAIFSEYGVIDISGQASISENVSGGMGGGILSYGSEINISEQAVIAGNTSEDLGGGIYSSGGELKISGQVVIEENIAAEAGGGIYSEGDDIFTIEGNGVEIKGNSTREPDIGGSAIYLEYVDKTRISGDVRIEDNGWFEDEQGTAQGTAAIVYMEGEDNEISGSVQFVNNFSSSDMHGGAITLDGSSIKIKDSVQFRNNTSVNGGAILIANYDDEYSVSISDDVIFDANNAVQNGGAVFLENGVMIIRDDVQFLNNSASYGGAIHSLKKSERDRYGAGSPWIIDNDIKINGDIVFKGNKAENDGGAVYIDMDEYEELLVRGAVFENNYAAKGYRIEDPDYLAVYDAQIKDVNQVSEPFERAYNNLDIHYTDGNPFDIYIVSFDLNGGEVENPVRDQYVFTGGFASRPEEEPEKQWYLFKDWTDESDDPWKFDENEIHSDTTIYAMYIKDTTLPPQINDLYEDENKVTGGGIPGAKIEVVFPDGQSVVGTVDEHGAWEVNIPDGADLKEGDKVQAIQTEGEKEESTEAETIVKGLSRVPEIDDVYIDYITVTGRGVPGSRIKVIFQSERVVETTTGTDSVWSVAVPVDENLKLEDTIRATQTEIDRKESGEASVKVKEVSQAPVIDIVYIDNETVSGTGIADAQIEVLFPGGAQQTAAVAADNTWEVLVPGSETLVEGETIGAVQTENRKEKSPKTETVIRGISALPEIGDVYAGDRFVEGTGIPESVIRVTFMNGREQRATVNAKGEWTVKVPDDVVTVFEDRITAAQTEVDKKTSSEAETRVKDISESPVIKMIYDDDELITGRGIAGSAIKVTFENGAEIHTTVNTDNTWSIGVPSSLNLIPGEVVSAYQTENGKKQSRPTEGIVLTRYVSEPPVIHEVFEEDQTVSGTGIAEAGIEVLFPGGDTADTAVEEDGTWSAVVPEGEVLTEGDIVSAVQFENNKKPSEKVTTIVKAKPVIPDPEVSEMPVINSVYTDNEIVSGTGIADAQIEVMFAGGAEQTAVVAADSTWEVLVPESETLVEGEAIGAVQTESSKEKSLKTETIIRGISVPPEIGDVYAGDRYVDGTGIPESIVRVTFINGKEQRATVNAKGEWIVKVPDDVVIVFEDRITAAQTEVDKKTSSEAETRAKDISQSPVIKMIYDDDEIITGRGIAGSAIKVTFENGAEVHTAVSEDDTWSIEVPSSLNLLPGQSVSAYQTEIGKKQSRPTEGIILTRYTSAPPVIHDVFEEDPAVAGTGIANAEIEVLFPGGDTADTVVETDGTWSVVVPEGEVLLKGDIVSAVQSENNKKPSEKVTTAVKEKPVSPGREKSEKPKIDDIQEGDREVTGKGEPGAEIEVTFPNGDKEKTIVDEEGNWKVKVPEGVELKEGDKVTAVQTEEGKDPSDEAETTVKEQEDREPGEKEKSEKPKIDDIQEGDREVTGKGEPGAEIEVTFPNGDKEKTIVDEEGNWKVKVPEGVELKEGDKVTAVQTEEGKDPSDEAETTVKEQEDREPGGKEKSEKPKIDDIQEGDREATGKGEPGAEVEVTFPNGDKEKTIVDEEGNWKVKVPEGVKLKEGDKVTAVQTEEGKDPSAPVETVVKGKVIGKLKPGRDQKDKKAGNKSGGNKPKTFDSVNSKVIIAFLGALLVLVLLFIKKYKLLAKDS